RTAAAIEAALAQRGVLVRGLANYGMPDFLRITIGAPAAMAALASALEDSVQPRPDGL
ncbi:MAG TPA: histidinol-phosphate transaminase, partial [Hyphomonadaceae bacterium]|nr:histidinol-phosphate transaminase [Hyphomonadaceae bacterium]